MAYRLAVHCKNLDRMNGRVRRPGVSGWRSQRSPDVVAGRRTRSFRERLPEHDRNLEHSAGQVSAPGAQGADNRPLMTDS